MTGYTQKDFERVVKHARSKLGFTHHKKLPVVHAAYFDGALEIFRDPQNADKSPIVLEGLVQRTFTDESVPAICRVLDDAKLEADSIIQNFAEVRQQILENVTVPGHTFRLDAPAECPDIAGILIDGIEVVSMGAESRDVYTLRTSSVKGARHKRFDSVPKLKAAAKRAVNKYVKDLKK